MPDTLSALFAAPHFDDEEKSRRAGLLHVFSWGVVAVVLLYAVGTACAGVGTLARLLLVLLVVPAHGCVQWLMRKGRVRLASWVFCLGICVVLFTYAATTTESRDLTLDALIVVMMIAGLLLGFRAATGIAVLSIGASALLWYGVTKGILPGQPIASVFFAFVVVKALFVLAALFVLYLAVNSLERAFARERSERDERQRSDRVVRRLLQAVEQSQNMVVVTDAQGNLEYVNSAFTGITGYAADEVLGKNPRLLGSGIHSSAYYRDLWERVLAGHEWRGEFANRRRNGTMYWERASIAPVRDEAGTITHLVKVAEDITTQKKVEQALGDSEARFREMAENISEVFWIFDWEQQRVIYVNPAYEKIWGRSARNILDDYAEWGESIHPDDRAYAEESFAAIAETGGGEPREYRILHPDGEVRWIQDRGFAIRDESGSVVRIVGIAADITEQKRTEQELRQSESRFRGVVERSTDGIVVTDEQGRIIEWNRSAEQITGQPAEDVLGHPIWDVQVAMRLEPPATLEQRAHMQQDYRSVLKTGYAPWLRRMLENEIRSADGTRRMIQSIVFSIPTERGVQLASILRDVTESRRTEKSLVESLTRYRMVFENASDAIFIIGNARMVDCNPRAMSMFGCPRDQIIGKTPYELSPPTQPDGTPSKDKAYAMIQAARHGSLQHFEWRHMRCDGTLFDVMVSMNRIEIAGQEFLQAIVHDITDRVRAEALVQRQLRVEHMLSSVSSSFVGDADLEMAMHTALGALGDLSGADRVYIFEFGSDMTTMRNTYEWCREDVASQFESRQNLELGIFSWFVLQLQQNCAVQVADVSQLPDELVDFRRYLKTQEIDSVLAVPLTIGKQLYGFLGVDNAMQPEMWSEDAPVLLRVVAEILGNALERYQALAALRIRDWAVASAINGVALADMAGNLTYVNNALMVMWGYQRREAMLGRPLVEFWKHPDLAEGVLASLMDTGSWTGEEVARRADDTLFTVQISASLIFTNHGTPLGIMASFIDVTERKRIDEMLQASLREKDVLLQEIHHRVNNTMQIIQSLLRIQAAHIDDVQVRDMLGESRDRIQSMALVHEKLYRSSSLAEINVGDYVRSLATHLFQSCRVAPGAIELQVDIPAGIAFGIDMAIPCGLILNELITNVLKHAFPVARPHQTSIVYIGMQVEGSQLELVVSDNGVGLKDSINFFDSESLGLQLVHVWAEQLDAQVNVARNGGTLVRLTFPGSC